MTRKNVLPATILVATALATVFVVPSSIGIASAIHVVPTVEEVETGGPGGSSVLGPGGPGGSGGDGGDSGSIGELQ